MEISKIIIVFQKYDEVRGEGFLSQTRRERRSYPPAVCKERATKSGAKSAAARRVAPPLAWGVVAPRSQTHRGYACARAENASSRLAPSQRQRNKRHRIFVTRYLAYQNEIFAQ